MNTQDQTDEQLLGDFAEGNHAALGDLAHRYESMMLGLACGLLGQDRSLACDAVQDAWVRVIRHGSEFRRESTVKTWLYRITINCCKDVQQKCRRYGRPLALAHESTLPGADPNRAEDADRRHRLNEALMALPANTRTLLLLCYQQGLTHTFAADVLGIPVGTLKSRLNAALHELRQRLQSEVAP
ncbi:MAG: RNA polymerase sigma factor [Phycisphaerales bacterium]|nr:RNA polymerase sigma factor [Phycisphaerales bacterium]